MKVQEVLGLKVNYNYEVSGISINSKKTKRNDIFVAIKGKNYDGNHFINELIKRKVKTFITSDINIYKKYINEKINIILVDNEKKELALLCKRFYQDISKNVTLIGVTGTNGKTTVTTLVYKYMRYLGKNVTMIGSNGIYINDNYYKTINTTPDIITTYETIKKSVNENINFVIMEVSSQGIKEDRVSYLQFHIGLFTNLSLDHLDYHKTLDDYFYTKLLFLSKCEKIIVNRDSDRYLDINRFIDKKIITFGKSNSDIKIDAFKCTLEKTIFDLLINDNKIHINTSLLGEYNIYNIASFIAIIKELDLLNKYTLSFLNKNIIIDGRFEIIKTKKAFFVIDYAHTPDGIENILKLLNSLKKSKLIVVTGMGGNRDKSKRKITGKILQKFANLIILTEDNSRDEETKDIIDNIKEGIDDKSKLLIIYNRYEAIKKAYELANSDDIIAVLGKGCEREIICKNKTIPFNDKEEVLKIVKE